MSQFLVTLRGGGMLGNLTWNQKLQRTSTLATVDTLNTHILSASCSLANQHQSEEQRARNLRPPDQNALK